jgi:predicted flap endonuclease-1-like 5' DNA nuclease
VTYLVSQILPLLLAAGAIGTLLGWYVTRWVHRRQVAFGRPSGDEATTETDELLTERDQQLTELRTDLDRRVTELTAARRQLADIKEGMRDTVGLEAELITAREMAEKVPGLQAQVAQLTTELASRPALAPAAAPAAAATATSPAETAGTELVIDLREPTAPVVATQAPTAPTAPASPAAAPAMQPVVAPAPATGDDAVWQGDDLTQIEGITHPAAEMLRARGVRSFAQLANLSPSELAGLDASLGEFAGQATNGGWVGKAAERVARQRFGANTPQYDRPS